MFYVFTGILTLYTFVVLSTGDDNSTSTIKTTSVITKERKLKDYDWSVWCKFQPNGYNCGKAEQSRFYYDIKMEACKTFSYGGCPTHFNDFGTLTDCHDVCRDAGEHPIKAIVSDNVSCRLQPDFGLCDGYYPMWYFDINRRVCRGFSYSGCGGNNNRFPNAQICTAVCASNTEF